MSNQVTKDELLRYYRALATKIRDWWEPAESLTPASSAVHQEAGRLLGLTAIDSSCPTCAARRRKVLEDAGWTPVAEFLNQAETNPLMVVLSQINAPMFQEVAEELKFYASRPAFFNEATHDLIECGDWENLYKHEYGELD